MSTILIAGIAIVALVGLAIGMGVLIGANKKPDDVIVRKGIPTGFHCPTSANSKFTELIDGKCFEPCPEGYHHSKTDNYHFYCIKDCPEGTISDPKGTKCTGMGNYQRDSLGQGPFSTEKHCEEEFGVNGCERDGFYWRKKCREGYHGLGFPYGSWCLQDCPEGTYRPKGSEILHVGECLSDYDVGPRGDAAADMCPPEGNPSFIDLISGKCYQPCSEGYVPDGTKCTKIQE